MKSEKNWIEKEKKKSKKSYGKWPKDKISNKYVCHTSIPLHRRDKSIEREWFFFSIFTVLHQSYSPYTSIYIGGVCKIICWWKEKFSICGMWYTCLVCTNTSMMVMLYSNRMSSLCKKRPASKVRWKKIMYVGGDINREKKKWISHLSIASYRIKMTIKTSERDVWWSIPNHPNCSMFLRFFFFSSMCDALKWFSIFFFK